MAETFRDHFSSRAAGYATFRPTYPEPLFDWLAGVAPGRSLAWDCATGTGQAARPLARRFDRVIATDASRRQIATARAAAPGANLEYRVAPAEASGLEAHSVDLVTVAQALHWLDLPRFYTEVRRVGRPGAVVAAWCYTTLRIDERIDEVVSGFYDGTVGPCWPPERAHVDSGYRNLEFPFPELDPPAFSMLTEWTLADLTGYLRTWSAVIRYEAERGADPVAPLERELIRRWGDPAQRRRVTWPLRCRIGRVGETPGPDRP